MPKNYNVHLQLNADEFFTLAGFFANRLQEFELTDKFNLLRTEANLIAFTSSMTKKEKQIFEQSLKEISEKKTART